MLNQKKHTQILMAKIAKMARARMVQEKVVQLSDLQSVSRWPMVTRILVIEDDEALRTGLKRILENEGYRVLAVADGTQLNQVLDDQPLDLILLDVGLPWVNGFELAEMIKAHPDLNKVPLVFLSGRTAEVDIKYGFSVGAEDFIQKPFDIENIKKTVRTLIQLRHSHGLHR